MADERMTEVLEEIRAERVRQVVEVIPRIAWDDRGDHDRGLSRNDWLALIQAYTGRAAQGSWRNSREGEGWRKNLVKAAALIVAALEADPQE